MMNRKQMMVALCLLMSLIATAGADEKVAATVNGETISLAEVDRLIANGPPPLTPLTAAQKRTQRLEVVNALVDDRLVRQFLRDSSIMVDTADVDRQYAALEAAQAKEGRTMAEYLKEIGQTPQQLKANFRTMLQLAKHIDMQINDEKLKSYHESQREFFDKTLVRVRHIVIRLGAESTTEERQQATRKLTDLRSQIVARQIDFGTAAKQHSQCPSAPKGGDLGYIARKWQVDEAFAKAAFALKNEEISEIVESDFGLHLIQTVDRKPGKANRYEDVQTEVRECLEAELRQQLLTQLRKKAKVTITLP